MFSFILDYASSKYSFGIAVSAVHDVAFVQDAVATWMSRDCITSYDSAGSWQSISLPVPSLLSNGTLNNSTEDFSTLRSRSSYILRRRAFSTTVQAISGYPCTYSETRSRYL